MVAWLARVVSVCAWALIWSTADSVAGSVARSQMEALRDERVAVDGTQVVVDKSTGEGVGEQDRMRQLRCRANFDGSAGASGRLRVGARWLKSCWCRRRTYLEQ